MAVVYMENLLRASLHNIEESTFEVFRHWKENIRNFLSLVLGFVEHPVTSTCELYSISLDITRTNIRTTYQSLINNRRSIVINIIFVFLMQDAMDLLASEYAFTGKPPAVSVISSQVSGFYGPGAYAAWYITTAIKMVESLHYCTIHQVNGWQKPDFNTLTSIAYPLIALVDAKIQVHRSQYCEGNHSEFLAATYTFKTAIELLTCFCTLRRGAPRSRKIRNILEFLYFFNLPFGTNSLQIFSSQQIPCKKEGDSKWVLPLYILKFMLYQFWNPWFVMTAAALALRAWKPDGHKWCTPLLFLLAVSIQSASRLWYLPHSVFPVTDNRMGDLDQAAALGTMLLLLMYAHLEQVTSVCRLWFSQSWEKFLIVWMLAREWWRHGRVTIDMASLRYFRRPR